MTDIQKLELENKKLKDEIEELNSQLSKAYQENDILKKYKPYDIFQELADQINEKYFAKNKRLIKKEDYSELHSFLIGDTQRVKEEIEQIGMFELPLEFVKNDLPIILDEIQKSERQNELNYFSINDQLRLIIKDSQVFIQLRKFDSYKTKFFASEFYTEIRNVFYNNTWSLTHGKLMKELADVITEFLPNDKIFNMKKIIEENIWKPYYYHIARCFKYSENLTPEEYKSKFDTFYKNLNKLLPNNLT